MVLETELAAGNQITEVSDWPPKCKKLVILMRRFSRAYPDAALTYQELNDPHYWFADYMVGDGEEVLACRF
ncbi:MAG: hypothetical protein CMK07_08145 [Ponticaulis sp.]|nr:hypothetical protein [Ponticaulis sp.]